MAENLRTSNGRRSLELRVVNIGQEPCLIAHLPRSTADRDDRYLVATPTGRQLPVTLLPGQSASATAEWTIGPKAPDRQRLTIGLAEVDWLTDTALGLGVRPVDDKAMQPGIVDAAPGTLTVGPWTGPHWGPTLAEPVEDEIVVAPQCSATELRVDVSRTPTARFPAAVTVVNVGTIACRLENHVTLQVNGEVAGEQKDPQPIIVLPGSAAAVRLEAGEGASEGAWDEAVLRVPVRGSTGQPVNPIEVTVSVPRGFRLATTAVKVGAWDVETPR